MVILTLIFKLAAGVGLFLLAMYFLEESLKNLSGRNFKLFLQNITKNRIGAVAGGAIVTGVLQSSSMVSLMVLAFLGAGVFNMKNAMAIILGANLGTTLDSWVVATLGFKVDIEIVAYPIVFIAGLLLILFGNRKNIKYISFFLFGFGLLFIGLAFMKTAMEEQVQKFDFSAYADMSVSVFLLIGFIMTSLVQSSSVTMALTLSALHAGVIGFTPAAAIVLGSETGTTIKIVLASIGGIASKKRVAIGNFLFNLFLTVLTLIFLQPILLLITDIFKIKDPLMGLVTFSTLINLLGIFIILPFLNPLTKLLQKLFKNADASVAAFIGNANIDEPETALDLFRKETAYFIHTCMVFNLAHIEIDLKEFVEHPEFKPLNEKKRFYSKSPEEQYEFLKQWQGELQAFYLSLRTKVQDDLYVQLNQLISSVRNCMYSVKSIKDVTGNITNLSHSSKDIKFNFFTHHKKRIEFLYLELKTLMEQQSTQAFKKLQHIFTEIQENYYTSLNQFYKEAPASPIEDVDITTALNFNRELYSSNKAMLMAIKDFLLNEKEADEFNEIPLYQI